MSTSTHYRIGSTPLVRIRENLYAKLEINNPTGSIKDRMARFVLDAAEKRGEIKPGGLIVEATSGNTGIAFSMLAAERGYKMIVVMPCNMSIERKQMILFFGAQIIEVGPSDFSGAARKRDELAEEFNAFNPRQFSNPDNIECHRQTTGQEILQQLEEAGEQRVVEAFVAGTGTGGTLMGVRLALIDKFPAVATVAVEPTESAVMMGGVAGPHLIQGIGDGFIPEIVDMNLVDEVVAISSQDAIERMRRLTAELGLLVGISSGANILAAERYLEKHNPDGIVVTVLPDHQSRYASLLQ